MRQRFCRVCNKWHDAEADWPRECMGHWGNPVARSGLAVPMLIRDQIDPLQHPADGKYYDSKAEIRRVAKAHNLIEVGTEKQTDNRRHDPVTHDEVGKAIQMVNQGYKPALSAENDPLA